MTTSGHVGRGTEATSRITPFIRGGGGSQGDIYMFNEIIATSAQRTLITAKIDSKSPSFRSPAPRPS